MREIEADIWSLHPKACVVITTNQGWKRDGSNVMGAGLARQALTRFPGIDKLYGKYCRDQNGRVGLYIDGENNLIFLATKWLNKEAPHLSWRQDSSLELINRGLELLAELRPTEADPIAVPLLGTLNGNLSKTVVLPLMRRHLTADGFIIVHPEEPKF